MNTIKLKIGDETYAGRMSTPLTVQTTLNDTLDSAQFVLPYLDKAEPFEPMTDVELQIGESEPVIWLLADDQVQEIMGTGKYTHTVTLAEYTKITERILMEAKSFTNPLVANYVDEGFEAVFDIYRGNNLIYSASTGAPYYYVYSRGQSIVFPTVKSAFVHIYDGIVEQLYLSSISLSIYYSNSFQPDYSGDQEDDDMLGEKIFEESIKVDDVVSIECPGCGFYVGRYRIVATDGQGTVSRYYSNASFAAVPKVYKREPYSLGKVVGVLLNISSPLRTENICEWELAEDQKNLACMTQKSPEFAFQDSRSLWENLREIGRVIHAIPRVIKKNDNVVNKEVRFDFLGGTSDADFSNGKRISRNVTANIANYTAGLETMAANLISAEGRGNGSIVEPYGGGYKSLRTATETARIQEGTAFIETSLPIESIVKVEAHFTYDGKSYTCDISKYVFERDDYSLLSAFSGEWPMSRCFAIWFARGSNNIDGLWYKPNDGALSVVNALRNYAIVNILAIEANVRPTVFNQITYPDISFRVEYIPTVTARIHHYRPDAKRGAGLLANNQAANKLSAYALGENMRGQLAMLSTSTRSELWLFPKYEDIPKAGELVDDSLYISSVTARVYPGYCEAQIEMSENYNEQGAFVEMPSKFRQYEIPAGNERHTVIDEFCYISDHPEPDDAEVLAGKRLKEMIGDGISFLSPPNMITLAIATTYDEGGDIIAENLRFPVMSLAIGNSLYFGFSMRDNYAAGNKSIDGGEQYRMNQAVRYGDQYYSTVYSIGFKLVDHANASTDLIEDANAFPDAGTSAFSEGYVDISTGANPLIWYKDSADAGNIAYQLHFLTDSGYIIGSGLASFCSAVRNTDAPGDTQLYFFSDRLHPINGISDVGKAIGQGAPIPVIYYGFCDADGNEDKESGSNLYISTSVVNDIPASTKSWAIIRDGKFLLGRNEATPPKKIYFNFKRRLKK